MKSVGIHKNSIKKRLTPRRGSPRGGARGSARGTAPPLVLLILLYSGLPFAGVRLTPTAAVCVAFFCGLTASAKAIGLAARASVRGATATLASSSGLGPWQRPADLVSNTIEVVKLTSICSVVSFPERLYSADRARALTFNSSPVVLAAALYVAALWRHPGGTLAAPWPLVRSVGRLERGNASR